MNDKFNDLLTVTKFEYLRTIKKPAFWLVTLFMPVFIGLMTFISGYTSIEGEKKLDDMTSEIKNICLVDEVGLLGKLEGQEGVYTENELSDCKSLFSKGEVDLILHLSEDLLETNTYDVYISSEIELMQGLTYGNLGNNLIRQSSYMAIEDPTIITGLTTQFDSSVYEIDPNGVVNLRGFEKLIVPILSLMIFFLCVFLSANFMLQSVAEEKENRMMETMLSIIDKESLIYGKILGLSGVVITQILFWVILLAITISIGWTHIPFDISIDLSSIDWSTLPLNLYFTFVGFLIFSALMVGVGAIGTDYKDSQGLSSIFIILSILPIYAVMLIVAEPRGLISMIFTYFPLTSPMLHVLRNSLSGFSQFELILGVVLNGIFALLCFRLAIKLFDLGSLMYSSRPNIKSILAKITNRDQ